MKPVAFDYQRAKSVDEVLAALAASEGAAKVIAGGQSLGPMLNLRLARPGLLIDIADVAELKIVEDRTDHIFVGATTTHASIEDGVLPVSASSLLRAVAGRIAYRAVRNRGTIGGSIAHADPAADWMLTLTALNAAAVLRSPRGIRNVAVDALMRAPFMTVLAEDEIIVGLMLEKLSPGAVWSHEKFSRKSGKFADAAAVIVLDRTREYCRVVLGTPDAPPAILAELSELLLSEAGKSVGHAAIEKAVNRAGTASDQFELQLQTTIMNRAMHRLALL